MTGVNASQVETLLKILSTFNVRGALAAWQGEDVQAKVLNSAVTIDEVLRILGVFFPPVAIVANDVEVVIEGYEILMPILRMIESRFPYTPSPGTRSWGSVTIPDRGLFK